MTRIKICGLKTDAVMSAALDAGADDVGLVVFPPSPRNVSVSEAGRLAEIARGRARIVVLLVDAGDALIETVAKSVRPDLLQLHGSETPNRVADVKKRFGLPVMKAIKVATAADAEESLAFRGIADLILFDARPPKDADRPGGHGATFDWHALDAVKHQIDYMLSGGLTPANVADAIRATGAPAVDVSSGVETSPGVKDAELIRAFIQAVRALEAN